MKKDLLELILNVMVDRMSIAGMSRLLSAFIMALNEIKED